MAERRFDVVLFGATGFTGALTASYLAARAGEAGTRWALAGRSKDKLSAVRAGLGPAFSELPLVQADVTDESSMRSVAASTRVLVTTVGPYIHYGEAAVAACAAEGTDYIDLTGEPEFVDRMYVRHHERAVASGARLVHSCGFDSIPFDLGVLYVVEQLPEGVPLSLSGYLRAGGTFSGGTFHSAVEIMGRLRQGAAVARERRSLEGSGSSGSSESSGRRARIVFGRPHVDRAAGGWVVPAPTIDPQHVVRSARALERYGPDFSYSHYIVTGGVPATAGLVMGVGAVAGLAQLGPTRRLLLKARAPGDGPSEEQRSRGWFRVRIAGSGGGRRVVGEISGGDPGYGETAKMLAETALSLAHDQLPPGAVGQTTTAVALGRPLIDRLVAAGIGFRTLEGAEVPERAGV